MSTERRNVDPRETARFAALADTWWDPKGRSRALHMLNPVRLDYVQSRTGLRGREVLDVGCGAGLLCEAMAARGAKVAAIDASPEILNAARLHLQASSLAVDYHEATAEEWAREHTGRYELVTCMELIEHVPDPASLVRACARLVQPGGHVIFSTINRTPKAWLLAIVGAEFLLGMLPKGTHDYAKLVRPSELEQWSRYAGLTLLDLRGLSFNVLGGCFTLGRAVDVNYLAHFTHNVDED